MKQIGVKEIEDSRELPFFIQWLTDDHPSQDGNAVALIEKIVISDKEKLSDSWFRKEIIAGLEQITIDWVNPSNDEEFTGIIALQLKTPNGIVVLE